MGKAKNIISGMINMESNTMLIVIMIKFFVKLGELTEEEAIQYYNEIIYVDTNTIYSILLNLIPLVNSDEEIILDRYQAIDMIMFWYDYAGILSIKEKDDLLEMIEH